MSSPARIPQPKGVLLPKGFKGINPKALLEFGNLLLPDVAVKVPREITDGRSILRDCHTVTFDVTLYPALYASPRERVMVFARVTDKVFGRDEEVASVWMSFPATGGTTRQTIQFPEPEDTYYNPDFHNEISVEVGLVRGRDRDPLNNKVTVWGTCIG